MLSVCFGAGVEYAGTVVNLMVMALLQWSLEGLDSTTE